MPETPTSEGSIVAYLRVNDSDWNAKLDAAEQKARDLGRISPNIRVTADTADAIAKLDAARLAAERVGGNHVTTVTTVNESVSNATGSGRASQAAAMDAVTAANKRLEAAENAAGLAADRHALSIMRLNDALAKGNITETQRASLELTEASAQTRLAQAQDRVADAAAKVAAAESAAAAATDSQGAAADKAANGNKANLGYMGAILAVVAALVPVMSQLAGFIAGVGGAFAGMGAAGVLGVLGIKAAMADGTTTGTLYASIINQLQTNLSGLEQTAASGLLGPLNSAVQDMTAAMPQLNTELGGFSVYLGNIASTVMGTLVQGFAILNPLFREGAGYLQGLADAWAAWVNNGGLQRFAQDAEQALPLVAHTLSQLVSLVVNLIAALSPLGTVALEVINAVATGLNMVPSNVLVLVATGATAAFIAFKSWAILGPILESVATAIGAVGVATDIATGPVGWIIGLIGLAAGAVAALATSTNDNTAATTAYTTALQQSNGALDDNIRKTVAKQLADANVLETAKQYGLQLSTVTDAVLGNKDAQNQVNQAINQYGTHLVEVHGYQGTVTNTYTTLTDKARALKDAVDGNNTSLKESVKSYQDQQAAAANTDATDTQLVQATNNLTTALTNQTNAATFLNNAFKLLDGQNLSLAQAQTGQAAAFNTVTTALQQNGTAIDGNTKNAVANQQAIQQAATAAQQLAAATTTATGSTDQGTQSFMASKTALEQQLQAQGLLTPAVQAYIDTLFQVPKELTTQLNVDNAQAQAAIAATQSALDALGRSEKTYGIAPQNIYKSGVNIAFASGGTVGGPGSATSDSVYARLSRSEEVVSNGYGQADRFRSLLKLVNANADPRTVAGMALNIAGVHAQQQPQPRPAINVTMNITTNNGEQLFQAFQAKVNALAGP